MIDSERTCANCRYYDLPINVLPCKECKRCSSDGVEKWAVPINEMSEPSEKLEALCEYQMYTIVTMVELREELNNLIEVIKERAERDGRS